MVGYKRNLKLYAEEPARMARDQARFTTVMKLNARTSERDERVISVYVLRTISDRQLDIIWPYLPEPVPRPAPTPPPCREEGDIHPAFTCLFFGVWIAAVVVLLVCGAAAWGCR